MTSKQRTFQEHLETPIAYECDVLVAGGGTAGAVAAIAAARTGAKTMLVERDSFVGGTLVNGVGPMHSFFNLFHVYPEVEKMQVVKGISQEIVDRLIAEGGCLGHLEQESGGGHDSIATIMDREIYKYVIAKMLAEANVQLLLNTLVAGTVMDGDALTGVIIENKSGRSVIMAKAVVDCTGDADVAALAGAPYIDCSQKQAVSMTFAMANVDLKKMEKYAAEKGILTGMVRTNKGKTANGDDIARMCISLSEVPEFKELFTLSGDFANLGEKEDEGNPDSKVKDFGGAKFGIKMMGPFFSNYHQNELSYINCNIMSGVDGTNAEEVTYATNTLRARCVALMRAMRKYIPGCENAYISWTPSYLGVRASRIVCCEYELTHEDIINGQRFDDEIAHYSYHDLAPQVTVKSGKFYGIPYRALVPQKVDNLLVAGRLITTDFTAHMSTRNSVSCMAQGHAAGTAAALAALAQVRVRDLDTKQLQQKLVEQGSLLD